MEIKTAIYAAILTGSLAFLTYFGSSCGSSKDLPTPEKQTLREAVFPFGGAISPEFLKNDTQYRELAAREFSSITAEYVMKMTAISRGKDVYDFAAADEIIDFARKNKMRVHGHTLVWYRETPEWLKNYTGTREDFIMLLEKYIKAVAGHFKGKVVSWDVVNEALLDDGSIRIEENIWYQKIGLEYIEIAFRAAHKADPDALLFYNEYGQEYSKVKSDAVNKLMDELIEKRVPIHGIGLQMHTNANINDLQLKQAVRDAGAKGLKVHISELDVQTNMENNSDYVFTEESALKQKEVYRWATEAMMELPANQRFGITFWGVTDQYSWRWLYEGIPDKVLPFSEKYEHKPGYKGILEGLKEK